MTYAALRALVRASPDGITEDALRFVHGATPVQLERLERSGDARVETHEMAQPAITVRWFFPS